MPLNNPSEVTTRVSVAVKTADQHVNNSAVLVNDTHLLLPVLANEVLDLICVLNFFASDMSAQLRLVLPAAAACLGFRAGDLGILTAGVDQPAKVDLETTWEPPNADLNNFIVFWGLYIGGANAGTIQLQWCQRAAHASNTTMQIGSYMRAIKVS